MDLTYMSAEDWQEFEKLYPTAASFLRARTLRNELEHLRQWSQTTYAGMDSACDFKRARLAELEELFAQPHYVNV